MTFRDMGAAFASALIAIYILVVAQFGSFKLPLVILTPVPLTLIGIMLGHWLFGAPFSATSMIGFIALAGIIVRNSILLVDFIRQRRSAALPLRQVLLEAGAIRFKPILLTAIAAMIGAAVILFDPIFQGLRDLPTLRPCVVDTADCSCHSGNLRGAPWWRPRHGSVSGTGFNERQFHYNWGKAARSSGHLKSLAIVLSNLNDREFCACMTVTELVPRWKVHWVCVDGNVRFLAYTSHSLREAE